MPQSYTVAIGKNTISAHDDQAEAERIAEVLAWRRTRKADPVIVRRDSVVLIAYRNLDNGEPYFAEDK